MRKVEVDERVGGRLSVWHADGAGNDVGGSESGIVKYAQASDLLADAISRAHQHHRADHADRQAEHAAVLAQIKAKEAAIDRYHAAFENGTMDDATAGLRLKTLRSQIEQHNARRDEIAEAIDEEPVVPQPTPSTGSVHTCTKLSPAAPPPKRKAAIEALIAEIHITEQGLIPVFKIPGPAPHPRQHRRHSGERGTGSRKWCDRWGGWDSLRAASAPPIMGFRGLVLQG